MADHQSLGVEARALLAVLADKLEAVGGSGAAASAGSATPGSADAGPAAPGSAAAGSAAGEGHPVRCTGCPVCATLTYLKDHRELSAQLAQGALLIVGAVRQYLEQPPSAQPSPTPSSDPSQASVQRIDIT